MQVKNNSFQTQSAHGHMWITYLFTHKCFNFIYSSKITR